MPPAISFLSGGSNMKRTHLFASAIALFALGLLTAAGWAEPTPAITGTMDIQFNTRTPEGQEDGAPKKGVQDDYKMDLTINGNNKFQGDILRQPRIKQLKIRTIQWPRYDYNLSFFVKVQGVDKKVGAWVGPMAVDEKSGAYTLTADSGSDRALRITIDAGQSFTDNFGGVFYGASGQSILESIKRTVNGKEIEKQFQGDPMRFESVKLAKGPNPTKYPEATVNGSLDYDRETSNYYAKNLHFHYSMDGKDIDDSVTGSIHWIEDPNRATNGIGHYEFNLRFNEDKMAKPQTDDQAFKGASDDDMFFSADNNIPSLLGTIDYVDTLTGDGKDAVPTESKVAYHMTNNKLTDQQVMNFAKLWLIAVGPTNDE
jgi:hypothetical protein